MTGPWGPHQGTPPPFENAVVLEYPSGNWAGYLDADLAAELVPYWNAHADENQVLRAAPISSGFGGNQPERTPRASSRERAARDMLADMYDEIDPGDCAP